ncbi:uncharacterized protein LOC127249690 [Andrographis paniculata]|uniref:uncharacterized protein LOC127249690 n=1 Tax=Andrographis paniculata TaxID=175694 RepID=UPI0021E7D7B1|nr:uncharacterized protein LOC127249690 [Andrographis paniculata]
MAAKKLARDHFSFYCWILCVVAVLSLSGFVSWICLTPRNPTFGLFLHPGNASSPKSSMIIDLEVTNPNKRMGVYYNEIMLEILGGGNFSIRRNSNPGFYQGFGNVTTLPIHVHDSGELWQGTMDLVIKVETDVWFRIMKWKTKTHHIEYKERFNSSKISGVNEAFSGVKNVDLQNATRNGAGN